MRRKKAKPGDEKLIYDEREDSVERSSALSRLAADGRLDLEHVARQWLTSDDYHLAGDALSMLLTYWRSSSRIHDYVNTAIKWLQTSEHPLARSNAAICLGRFLKSHRQFVDEIVHALFIGLEQDEDEIVQARCYEELLKYISLDEAHKFCLPRERPFDRNTDVRWDLLEPLRRRFAR